MNTLCIIWFEQRTNYTQGVFIFENILTKDLVSFKDLEEIAFKIACEFAKS